MTLHQFGPIVPVAACSILAMATSTWNIWRIKFAYRARGRGAVEQMLKARGETLVDLSDVPFSQLPVTTGLSSNVVFAVRARTAEGEERTYRWAYEPRVFPWQSEAVKRLAHGIWIPA